MSLPLWEAVHDANARSEPLFDIDPDMAESTPPSLQRVLLAAATLWCRTLVWPSVREIASTAAVAASTSIRAVGSSAQLRGLLITSEKRTILGLAEAQVGKSRPPVDALRWAVENRMHRLASIDPALRALPVIASLATREQLFQLMATMAFAEGLLDPAPEWSEVA